MNGTVEEQVAQSPRTDSRFCRLYDDTFSAIRSYCLRRLPVSEVNDAVADVYLAAWRRIEDVPSGDDARIWLYGIARNVVRNADRSRRRRLRLEVRLRRPESRSEPGPETVVVQRMQDVALLETLSSLRSLDREVLRLSIWEDLSNHEIAEVLGIEAHAVTMRLRRARARLAKQLGLGDKTRKAWMDPQPVGEGGEQ